jgi:hypothetical protein
MNRKWQEGSEIPEIFLAGRNIIQTWEKAGSGKLKCNRDAAIWSASV